MLNQNNSKAGAGDLTIRPASIEDLEAIQSIYNHSVVTSVFTMDLEEKSYDDMLGWFNSHTGRFPAYVGVIKDKIIGIASLSKWAERKGYYPSCEASIYLSQDELAQGKGDQLLSWLIEQARDRDFSTIISFMTSTNKLAKNLVSRNQFQFIGRMDNVGYKHNRVISLDIYQFHIKTPTCNPFE